MLKLLFIDSRGKRAGLGDSLFNCFLSILLFDLILTLTLNPQEFSWINVKFLKLICIKAQLLSYFSFSLIS